MHDNKGRFFIRCISTEPTVVYAVEKFQLNKMKRNELKKILICHTRHCFELHVFVLFFFFFICFQEHDKCPKIKTKLKFKLLNLNNNEKCNFK